MKNEKKAVMITKKAGEDMLNNEQFEEKTISRKEIYSGKIIDVAVDEFVCQMEELRRENWYFILAVSGSLLLTNKIVCFLSNNFENL